MGREESLPVNTLTRYLTTCLDVGRIEITEHHLLSGGAIQQNWMLKGRVHRDGEHDHFAWVLRTNSLSAVSSSMGRGQEHAVLQAVHQHGGKVPRPLHLCEDAGIIGSLFSSWKQ